MKNLKYILAFILIITIGSEKIYSTSINAGDTITSNTTWSADTVKVISDIHIPNSVRLTINAGTVVQFQGHYEIYCTGGIIAIGSVNDSIIFTPVDTITGWDGIQASYANDTIMFKYCLFEFAKSQYISPQYFLCGGALSTYYSAIYVNNSLFSKNSTNAYGGGLCATSSTGEISDNIFEYDSARYGGGASIYNFNGICNGNIVKYNHSLRWGGGMFIYSSSQPMIGNLIFNNTSSERGGGICIGGNTAITKIINTIIVNNTAEYGGGCCLMWNSTPQFINSTITNNLSTINGGGVFCADNNDAIFTSTIIHGNKNGNSLNQLCINQISADPDFRYCNVQGGTTSFTGVGSGFNYTGAYVNNIDTLPVFDSVTAGAGNSYNASAANWELQQGSPCINAGDTSSQYIYNINLDANGNPRVFNGRVDIGAYENQQPFFAQCTISSEVEWDADTIVVNCNVNILNGAKLKIRKGTNVIFYGQYYIDVDGTIEAIGTAEKPILFDVIDTTGFMNYNSGSGGWKGLRFYNIATSNDSSKLIFCKFIHGKSVGSSFPFYLGGGSMYLYAVNKLIISNCLFTNNIAHRDGGALYISSSDPIIINNTFCNNATVGPQGWGGGIYLTDALPTFNNNTIVNNSAIIGGGMSSVNCTETIKNCIFYGNISTANNWAHNFYIRTSSTTFYNCLFETSSSYSINWVAQTIFIDSVWGDPGFISPSTGAGPAYPGYLANWNIEPSSICINAGQNVFAGSEDLSGALRKIADTLDIGAFECQISPKFILADPINSIKCINTQASFSVNTSTPFTCQWQKNDVDISGATTSPLILDSVQLADTGYYSCKLSNNYGTIETDSATLTVRVPPTITSHPNHDTACYGDSASFSIIASGSEPISYQWYNNNGQVSGTYNTYNINAVNANNVSIYYCSASNNCGSAQSNGANLVMNTVPVISSIPSNYTICENQSLTYSVNTTGTSPISYQWYFNNSSISSANTNTFNITSLNTSNAGIYYCKATNLCGADSTNSSLLVVDSIPDIVSQTSNSASCAGQSMTFNITATGTAPITYQWYFNNTPISGANNNIYTINSVQNSDGGTYYCIATNSCGSDQSNNITLTVNQAPAITSQSSNITKCVGQTANFSITASGTSPITYQWYNDTSSISGATNNSYTIGAVSTSNAGNYYCIATNLCGNAQSTNKILTINAAPTITSQSSNTTKCSRQSSTFLVTATGTSPITYQWYKDNNPISGAISSIYSMSSIDTPDAGNYYYIATNICGTDQSNNITLTINVPPIITAHSSNAARCVGQSMTFSITSSGTSPITHQWYDDNGAISNATNSIFTINSVATTDADNYYCIATNSCGTKQSTNIELTVNTAPTITTHSDSSSLCSGQNMILNVTSTGTLPKNYQWYFNNFAIPGAANNFYLLSSIDQTFAGNYHCKATNLCGTDPSKNINLIVNEPISILSQSTDSSRCVGESMTFNVNVSGTAPITYEWYYDTIAIPNSNFNSSTIPDVAPNHGGTYKCMITNMCGTESSTSKVLTVNENPVVNLGIDTTFCKGGSITLSAGSGYFCNWNNGSNNPQLNVTETGDYFVNITDINGCNGISDTAFVNVIEPYSFEEICVVTVFPTTGNNLIAWERTSGKGIIGYNIYKESVIGGQYQLIGTLPFDSLSVWVDNNSNPKQRADRYRITAIDTCGNESAPSAVHKTIHLSASKGTSGENNLHWNNYEGFPFDYYRIYRGTKPSNITIIDSIQSTLNDYSDLNPPGGTVFYQVTAAKNDTCYPAIVRGITSSGPYSQSLSNIKDYSNAPGNYLTIDPPEIVLDSNAGSGDTVGIYTNTPYWSAMTNESWLQLTPNLDEGTLIVTASSKNTASEARTGLIVISGDGVDNQTIIVEQLGKWGSGSTINEVSQNSKLKIYPNPFNQSTHIILPGSDNHIKKLEVFDISGKLARSIENINGNRYELFKEELSTGLYFIRVIADRIYFDKVIVE